MVERRQKRRGAASVKDQSSVDTLRTLASFWGPVSGARLQKNNADKNTKPPKSMAQQNQWFSHPLTPFAYQQWALHLDLETAGSPQPTTCSKTGAKMATGRIWLLPTP